MRLSRALSALLGAVLISPLAHADRYTVSVYCANDKIEVDSRDLEQMRSARGSDVCQFGQFNFLSSAEDFAEKNFGGKGKACTCGH